MPTRHSLHRNCPVHVGEVVVAVEEFRAGEAHPGVGNVLVALAAGWREEIRHFLVVMVLEMAEQVFCLNLGFYDFTK